MMTLRIHVWEADCPGTWRHVAHTWLTSAAWGRGPGTGCYSSMDWRRDLPWLESTDL